MAINLWLAALAGTLATIGVAGTALAGDITISANKGVPPSGTCSVCVGWNIQMNQDQDALLPPQEVTGYFDVENDTSNYYVVGFAVSDPNAAAAGTDVPGWRNEVYQQSYIYFDAGLIDDPSSTGGVFTAIAGALPSGGHAIGPSDSSDQFEFFSIKPQNQLGPGLGEDEWDLAADPPFTFYAMDASGDLLSCSGSVFTGTPGSCGFSPMGVPEPSTLLLFGAGIAGLVGIAVARRRTQYARA